MHGQHTRVIIDDEMTVFIACVAVAWSRKFLFVYMLGLSAGYNLCRRLVECTVACRMHGGLWTVAAWSFGRAANHARLIEYATVIIVIVHSRPPPISLIRHFFSHWLASSFVACGRGKGPKSAPLKEQETTPKEPSPFEVQCDSCPQSLSYRCMLLSLSCRSTVA